MPSRGSSLLTGAALAGGAVWSANTFVTPGVVMPRALRGGTVSQAGLGEDLGMAPWSAVVAQESSASAGVTTTMGAALGFMSVAALAYASGRRKATRRQAKNKKGQRDGCGVSASIPVGKHGFVGETAEPLAVISRCPTTGRAQAQQVRALTAMAAAGADTSCAINGFGRIGRNVLRCWLGREVKPFDIVALNIGSMSTKTASHLLKYDTVLGTLQGEVSFTDESITVNDKVFKVVTGRDPAKMPWGALGVEVVIESTGAFNTMEGGSKHLEAGAKKVVLTAPGKKCPTYVLGVNEGKYDAEMDTVISNASCTTNAMAPVCKVLDESFGVEYGVMTTTHSYTSDQMILDGRHEDLRRARAGACNIVPTSTGAAAAVAEVLPKFKGKLNGIALRVPTPNVSVVDLVVKVSKKCSKEDVNKALKAAAEGPLKGIIHFEEQPLVSSDFMGSSFSNSVDAALTMVMGDDLVKVILWYDNEYGYSQRVLDLTGIVAAKMPVAA